MPVKRIFVDDNNNELEAYVNDDAKLFLSVGQSDDDSPGYNSGYIVLDRSDLDELIDLLMNLKDQVFDESALEDTSDGIGNSQVA